MGHYQRLPQTSIRVEPIGMELNMAALQNMNVSPPSTAGDPRWARVLARDRTADGLFWYSVITTRIYCRPSCPSRSANPKNVTLHPALASAKATGFRACKRCKPDEAADAASLRSLRCEK